MPFRRFSKIAILYIPFASLRASISRTAEAARDILVDIMAQKSHHIDYALLAISSLLMAFGILILSAVSAKESFSNFGNTTHYLFRQILMGVIPGVALGFLAYKINLGFFKKFSWIFILLGFVLMMLVFLPGIGIKSFGASRWLYFKSFSFQPSEFLKLFFAIYISAFLANRFNRKKESFKSFFLPFFVVLGAIFVILNFQKDLGTLFVILIFGGMAYFVSGSPIKHIIFMMFILIALAFVSVTFFPYRIDRLKVYFDPLSDPMNSGYQSNQSYIALGSGGIFGLGLGISWQNIPHAMSDSIFVAIGEQLGFLFCSLIVLFFLLFVWRAFVIAKRAQNNFSKILAICIGSWIGIQAIVNMSALIGIMPLTGIPLPFISQGGTHVMAELIAVGFLLNISKERRT